MNKKILIGIGVLMMIAVLFTAFFTIKPTITEESVSQRFSEFETQYEEKKAQGYDVTKAEEFARKAKQYFDRKDYRTANKLLDGAFEALEGVKIFSTAPDKLTGVEVASLYERVTDGMGGRSVDDVSNILKEMKTDFIFMGWWRWLPCPESPETVLPPEYPSHYVDECTRRGYTYEHLENAIAGIKEENPDIIFCGSVPAQHLTRLVWNPLTGEHFGTEETWEVALDPEKWGIDCSKEKFQCEFAKTHFWVDPDMDCKDYDYKQVNAYFPDITNKKFQELVLSWAKKQVDCGADAIWIDMLFRQAVMLQIITNDPYHPAVKDSFEGASNIVDEIREYGYSKGKYIYVGSWPGCVKYPYPQPNFDFVTVTPSSKEIYLMELDKEKWDDRVKEIRENLGDISIFILFDWAADEQPTAIFSQHLTPEEQIEFLRIADEFFQEKEIKFIYPVHGGYMGQSAKTLSFGEFKIYDSLAPEFETYEILKELAQNKSKIEVKSD